MAAACGETESQAGSGAGDQGAPAGAGAGPRGPAPRARRARAAGGGPRPPPPTPTSSTDPRARASGRPPGRSRSSLLSSGARSPATVAERVARDAHPDLTWVSPSGASEMLVADIEEPVVAAATRTPFESARRVFVIESVEAMNDQSANRMLKTLEEPLGLRPPACSSATASTTCSRRSPRAASWCASTRCPPIASRPRWRASRSSVPQACARLALGDARLAAWLAGEEGEEAQAERRGVRAPGDLRGERLAAVAGADRAAAAAGAGASEAARRGRRGEISSCSPRESANATNANCSTRAGAASVARGPACSTSRCGWRSCGCVT